MGPYGPVGLRDGAGKGLKVSVTSWNDGEDLSVSFIALRAARM